MNNRHNKAKDNKPWYEILYYIIGIIVSIFAILGVSIVGILKYFEEDNNIPQFDGTAIIEFVPKLLENEPSSIVSDAEGLSVVFLSEEYIKKTNTEKIIEDNMDFILQQKSKKERKIVIDNDFVNFVVTEESARAYYHINDVLECFSAVGKEIPFPIILLFDYETDEIICKLTADEKGKAEYHPLSPTQVIYCVVIASNYDLYVSYPIKFEEDGSKKDETVFKISKMHDEYTSGFQIAVNDLNDIGISNKDIIVTYTLKTNEFIPEYCYDYKTNDTGYVIFEGDSCYFELNTRYLLNIYLNQNGDYKTIDGSITNTNLFTVQFNYNTIEE